MENSFEDTARRKADHIRIALEEPVQSVGVTNGFERYRLRNAALPELAFEDGNAAASLCRMPAAPVCTPSAQWLAEAA